MPECNVSISGDQLLKYGRADISVAVSIPGGLITPIVAGADAKSLSSIAKEIHELAGRAKEGKLQPMNIGRPASLSNWGYTAFQAFAVSNRRRLIMAIGRARKALVVAKLADRHRDERHRHLRHRAIDGADGAP